MSRSPWFPPALVFAALAALYGATLCPTVGAGDSGELAAVLASWGVAHSPGFPLLSLLGNLVSLLPLPGEPALALNLMNALFAALTCAVLAHAVGVAGGDRWAGFAAALILGVSRTFWEYALVLEVFSLNTLFAALLLDLLAIALRGRESGGIPRWALPATAAVMAGVVTHHTTLVLLAAPVAVVMALAMWGRRARATRVPIAPALLAGLLALAPLLYLPIAASFDPPFNWGDARSPAAIMDLLLRRDFGSGTLMAPAIVANEVLVRGEAASPLGMRHFLHMGADLPRVLGWPALALALAGLCWCARRARPLLLLTALFAAAVTLFYSRVNAPFVPLYIGIARPFALLPHLYMAFLAGLGLAWLLRSIGGAAIFGAVLATIFVTVITQSRVVRQSGNVFSRDFGVNFIAGQPERALVFSNGDYFRNTVLYARLGLGLRPDLVPIEQPLLSRAWYISQLRRRSTLVLPGGMRAFGADTSSNLRALLDLNLGARPVTTVGFVDESWTRDYEVLPMGLWARVERREPAMEVGEWARSYAEVVARWRIESLDDPHPPETWEHSQGRFYPYALGSLRALLDVAALLGDSVETDVPALAVAERWQGERRGEYLADQADLWRRFLTDWRTGATARRDSIVAARAVTLARASLEVDSAQIQALQTLAAVMSARERVPEAARHGDRYEEAVIRHRIVALRPGDPDEAVAYFTLVRSLAGERDPRVPEMLRVVELDRRRYQQVLRLALRISRSPVLEQRLRDWDLPIASRGGS